MSLLAPTLLEDYRHQLEEPAVRDGGSNDIRDEMPLLLKAAREHTRPAILEIGVRSGRSTSAFLAGIAGTSWGGHLYSIDAAAPEVPERWFSCGYWTFKQARSGDVTPELLGWPAKFDVVFIDGDHELRAVLGDLRRFVPYCAPGGLVLCHDTKLTDPRNPEEPPQVAAALDLFCAEWHLQSREYPWQPGEVLNPPKVSWQERGGQYGLGVIESPCG